jgi:hypothetical protein
MEELRETSACPFDYPITSTLPYLTLPYLNLTSTRRLLRTLPYLNRSPEREYHSPTGPTIIALVIPHCAIGLGLSIIMEASWSIVKHRGENRQKKPCPSDGRCHSSPHFAQ